MKPSWHFRLRHPDERTRDSANGAFFTAESLENLSEALVREGIQNSLDAAPRSAAGIREVRVRISLVPRATGDAKVMLDEIFSDARVHFEKGIQTGNQDSAFDGEAGYLTLEDFGTIGLNGDIAEWRLAHTVENGFWSFFRAEGRSAKSGDSLGRWGIGKQVFPTASVLHAMFGLTVRSDEPARVLMGSTVISSRVVDGQDFDPDGLFGLKEKPEKPVLPIVDATYIDRFARAFDLQRSIAKGLSVLVPWIDKRVNSDDLRRGIVHNFFWPILQGELVVELLTPEGNWRIDHETLSQHRSLLPASAAAVVEFANWAAFVTDEEKIKIVEEAAVRPDWRGTGDALLTAAKLDEIRECLETQNRAAVKVPVRVRPKDPEKGGEQMSYFTVFIELCRDAGHRPLFLRDGILISHVGVRGAQISGSRSLVAIEHKPLAGLLGDSEGVNHTEWQKDSPKFHNHYVYGPETIKFVARSVHEILQRLHAGDVKGEPNLLLDVFYLPDEDAVLEKAKRPQTKQTGGTEMPKLPDIPESQPRLFELRRVDGGFILAPGKKPPDSLPMHVRIQAGYAVRRGNPIKKWARDDFVFTRTPLRLEPKPVGISWSESGNILDLEIKQPDFVFGVCGFDKQRDLVVTADRLKHDDETDV